MNEKLNILVKTIEEYFKNCLWNSRPPIKEIDFQLVVLSQKIIDLRNNLDTLKNVDYSINQILTFIEETFGISSAVDNGWIREDIIRHQLVQNIYVNLLNLKVV